MDNRKQAIIDALRAFVNQRPGFDLHNYATMADYRSDSRRATRQKAEALQLLRDIELRDSITAEDILREAMSGRVTIEVIPVSVQLGAMQESMPTGEDIRVDYCTGQYWCTEFRGAVARLCASVLWTWKREQCMPAEQSGADVRSPGDWLRASFRREYGKALSERYFS